MSLSASGVDALLMKMKLDIKFNKSKRIQVPKVIVISIIGKAFDRYMLELPDIALELIIYFLALQFSCARCGCSRQFDDYGDRICFRDSCSISGCAECLLSEDMISEAQTLQKQLAIERCKTVSIDAISPNQYAYCKCKKCSQSLFVKEDLLGYEIIPWEYQAHNYHYYDIPNLNENQICVLRIGAIIQKAAAQSEVQLD